MCLPSRLPGPECPCPLQERYAQYTACVAEQQLEPMRLQEFFRHSQDRGIPAL